MKRVFVLIFLATLFITACVKKPTADPVPKIDFVDFQAWTSGGNDTAQLAFSYEDGDGNLFRDESAHGPNFVATFYYLNSATQKFTAIMDPITNDTARITQTIVQPKDASYKGKSVKGNIYIPLDPFRSGDSVKIFKYVFFMEDESGNKSNIVTTPQISINF